MNITVNYDLKTFFNNTKNIEDVKTNCTLEDVKKVFRFLKTNFNITISINNTVIYWDSINDFNNEVLTIKKYEDINYFSYDIEQMSFNKCKNQYYKLFK